MRGTAILVLLVGAVITGCVQQPPVSVPTPAVDALNATNAFAFNITSPRCIETDVLFFQDKATIQKSLPSGFHAADATALTPVPAATGKGAFLLANVGCAESSIGSFNESALSILIEKPTVNGSRPAAVYDFYEVFRYVDAKNESKPFEAMAWDHAVVSDVVASQGAAGGTGDVRNGSSILRFVVTVTPQGPSLVGIGRFWHAVPDGLAFMDYKLSTVQRLGSVDCTLVAGSPFAKATGVTTCSPDSTAGMMFDPYKLEASIVNLPGAKAD